MPTSKLSLTRSQFATHKEILLALLSGKVGQRLVELEGRFDKAMNLINDTDDEEEKRLLTITLTKCRVESNEIIKSAFSVASLVFSYVNDRIDLE